VNQDVRVVIAGVGYAVVDEIFGVANEKRMK
jgi:hypothetical protein